MSLLDEDTGKIPVHTLESLLTDEPALDDTLIGSADQLRELLARTAPDALEAVVPNPAPPVSPVPPAPASNAEPFGISVLPSELGSSPIPQARPASAPQLGSRLLPSALPGGLSWSVWLVFGLLLGGLSCSIGRLLVP